MNSLKPRYYPYGGQGMKALSRFDLYELVRLSTIVWRANPAQRYSCYLSTERLVNETHYTPQNLRVAARRWKTRISSSARNAPNAAPSSS